MTFRPCRKRPCGRFGSASARRSGSTPSWRRGYPDLFPGFPEPNWRCGGPGASACWRVKKRGSAVLCRRPSVKSARGEEGEQADSENILVLTALREERSSTSRHHRDRDVIPLSHAQTDTQRPCALCARASPHIHYTLASKKQDLGFGPHILSHSGAAARL